MSKIFSKSWEDYELIDAGLGKKLERFGNVITIRPEIQAYFSSAKPYDEWMRMAHFEFVAKDSAKGFWKAHKDLPLNYEWNIHFGKLRIHLELTQFKHLGVFPEQAENWRFIRRSLHSNQKFLNLFAYTGVASLVAREAEAEVIHVDAVKQLLTWAKNNMELSALNDIKWVLEDAVKFAEREVKRGHKYDGIIMDPPAFGYGAKGERWILDKQFPYLLQLASQLLNAHGFLIINTYSPKLEISELKRLSRSIFPASKLNINELWMRSTTGKELYYGNLLRVEL